MFFTVDGFLDGLELFEIAQLIHSILSCERMRIFMLLVLANTLIQVGCHPCVEGAIGLVEYDIDIASRFHGYIF